MKHVRKSVLLWYSARQMYDLVTDVRSYPRFLPWCSSAEVLEEHDGGMTARLGLSFSGLQQAFTTRNVHEPGRRVQVGLVDGPFSNLEGDWHFVPLGEAASDDAATAASAAPEACRIELDLRYALRGGAFEALLSPVFDRVANTLVDSFVQRAETVYGPR